MKVTAESRNWLLMHARYRAWDTVQLFSEAQRYTRGKLIADSREFAIALLLSRDELREFCAAHPEVRDERKEWRNFRDVKPINSTIPA
jgi:hypothetical protein